MHTGCESADLGCSLVSWDTFTCEVTCPSEMLGISTYASAHATELHSPVSAHLTFQVRHH